MKFTLLHTHKKEARLESHARTLSEYFRAGKIPRGLRVHLEPTIGRENQAFCEKWCEILNHCSKDLMLLIISHTKDELPAVKSSIQQQLEETKTACSNTAEYDTLIQDISAQITKYKQDLLEMKLSKFRRDTNDYKNDRVYPWLKHGPRPRPTRNHPPSDWSDTSGSERSQEQAPQQRHFFRRRQPALPVRSSQRLRDREREDPDDHWPAPGAARGERGGRGRGRRWGPRR